MWFITVNLWGAEPRGLSDVWQDWSFADVMFHWGSYNISSSLSQSHYSERGGRGRERSGAAWHPTRTGCGAEAASDNTSCWECRQPLVHLFSPLNHRPPNRKLLLRHFIYLSSPPHSLLEVLSLMIRFSVTLKWNKFFLSRKEYELSCTSCCRDQCNIFESISLSIF